jgi:hypothetical protein
MVSAKSLLIASSVVIALPSTLTAQRWGSGPVPRDGACFYQDARFRGEYFCIGAGDNLRAVPRDMNDRISSIRIFGRVEVTVFRDVRFEGDSTRFDRDVRNLREEGWNDVVSSIRVRANDFEGRRNGDRPWPRGSRNPEQVIRRAYQDLLGREPDGAGMRLYRSRMIDEGWSEEQVRDALRNSPEYRERSLMTPQKGSRNRASRVPGGASA